MPDLETLLRRLGGEEPWPVAPVSERREPLAREALGVVAVQLALSYAEWVRRRRTTISYVEDTTIRQRMSVDFALPAPEWSGSLSRSSRVT